MHPIIKKRINYSYINNITINNQFSIMSNQINTIAHQIIIITKHINLMTGHLININRMKKQLNSCNHVRQKFKQNKKIINSFDQYINIDKYIKYQMDIINYMQKMRKMNKTKFINQANLLNYLIIQLKDQLNISNYYMKNTNFANKIKLYNQFQCMINRVELIIQFKTQMNFKMMEHIRIMNI